MTSVAVEHRDEIIQRMSKGEAITNIARSLGYASHTGIINRLSEDPEYQAALKAGIIAKLEQREKDLESASENVTVTRADRLLGHTRWWAERINPAQFGQRSHVTVEHVGDLGERLRKARERIIEGECVVETPMLQRDTADNQEESVSE